VHVLGVLGYLSTLLLPIGGAALFAYANRAGAITRGLAAVGKSPLTGLLLVEVVVFVALEIGGVPLPSWVALLLGVGSVLVVLAVGLAFDRSGRRGPVETLLRKITYGR
jgi:uncharacterized protein